MNVHLPVKQKLCFSLLCFALHGFGLSTWCGFRERAGQQMGCNRPRSIFNHLRHWTQKYFKPVGSVKPCLVVLLLLFFLYVPLVFKSGSVPYILFVLFQVSPISCPDSFYRAMHFSAKCGIAIACRLSVCDVGEL